MVLQLLELCESALKIRFFSARIALLFLRDCFPCMISLMLLIIYLRKNNNKMKNKRKKMNNIFNFRKKVPVKLVQEIVKIVKLN